MQRFFYFYASEIISTLLGISNIRSFPVVLHDFLLLNCIIDIMLVYIMSKTNILAYYLKISLYSICIKKISHGTIHTIVWHPSLSPDMFPNIFWFYRCRCCQNMFFINRRYLSSMFNCSCGLTMFSYFTLPPPFVVYDMCRSVCAPINSF